jgi:rRNA maturation RNase YbeY
MEIDIEVNNITQSPVKDDLFAMVAQQTITLAGYDFLQAKKISISVALVSEKEMQSLNQEHRQKDSVTDILSFCEYESAGEIEKVSELELFLGELILCYDDISKYALEKNIDLTEELINVASHGVLHLLGFEHGEKMFGIQKQVVNNFKNI